MSYKFFEHEFLLNSTTSLSINDFTELPKLTHNKVKNEHIISFSFGNLDFKVKNKNLQKALTELEHTVSAGIADQKSHLDNLLDELKNPEIPDPESIFLFGVEYNPEDWESGYTVYYNGEYSIVHTWDNKSHTLLFQSSQNSISLDQIEISRSSLQECLEQLELTITEKLSQNFSKLGLKLST